MTNFDMTMRILLIIVLSGIIGLDREIKHKPAGIKTHILVGMGSTVFMIVSLFIYYKFGVEAKTLDPGRIAAQVVTGIGFLGAGTIIQAQDKIKGLTTAASLWSVAAIGLAVGVGMYYLATMVTVMILVVFFLVYHIENMVKTSKNKRIAKQIIKK
jgi:putative Mg2+ transporter-C (MgtC) family protein